MQIPPEFVAALTGLITFVVTQGIKSISAWLAQFPFLSWMEISGFGSIVTVLVVNGLLFYINLGLGYVPTAYSPLVPLVFQFLIGVFAAFGAHLTMKRIGK